MRATTSSGSAYYVYGVVPAGSGPLAGDVVGVAESSGVETIEHDGVAAIVSAVPLDEFGQERLKENLNRMPWVETNVRAHERVLEHALDASPVVPLRFCTIFSSLEAVTAMLVEQEARLRGALEALAGKREWGVKAYLDERKLAATLGGDAPGDARGDPAGRAYFARKQRERSVVETVEQTTAAGAEDVHARLGALSTASTLLPLRPGGAETGPMVLNGAYLVERERDEEFAAALAEIQREREGIGFTFELTGPWPPYNFVPE